MPDSPPYPPLMHKSHEDGSGAALGVFFTSLVTWEILYHAARYSLKVALRRCPDAILSPSLANDATNGQRNGAGKFRCPSDDAKHALIQRGPSYVVSFIHSIYATARGVMHLCLLFHASSIDKLFFEGSDTHHLHRLGHLGVGRTNTVFLSYLCYDLFHILMLYPKLGGVDTILHHLLFASCSVINGTFGVFPYAFAWLIVGEGSTIFLNIRWFLLKSGREDGEMLGKVNRCFAASFFLTRIGIYTAGMFQLFYLELDEVRSLPAKSGMPISFLGMTCGSMLLGWLLNVLWGYKIIGMVRGKTKTKQQ